MLYYNFNLIFNVKLKLGKRFVDNRHNTTALIVKLQGRVINSSFKQQRHELITDII